MPQAVEKSPPVLEPGVRSAGLMSPVEAGNRCSVWTYTAAVSLAVVLHAGLFLVVGHHFLSPPSPGAGEDPVIQVTMELSSPASGTMVSDVSEASEEDHELMSAGEYTDLFPETEWETPDTAVAESLPEMTDINWEEALAPDPALAANRETALQPLVPLDLTPPPSKPGKAKSTSNNRRARPGTAGFRTARGSGGSGTGEAAGGGAGVILPRYRTNPDPPYPPSARQSGKTGTVKVKISLDAEGRPIQVSLASSSGHPELDNSALGFVKARWRFVPASRNGQHIPWTVIVPIVFSLKS